MGAGKGCPKGIVRTTDDVVFRLGFGKAETTPAEQTSEVHGLGIGRSVPFLEVLRPELASGPELGDLFPQVPEDVEVEGDPASHVVDVESPCEGFIDVAVGDLESERDLLCGVGAGFPNVIPTNRHRIASG